MATEQDPHSPRLWLVFAHLLAGWAFAVENHVFQPIEQDSHFVAMADGATSVAFALIVMFLPPLLGTLLVAGAGRIRTALRRWTFLGLLFLTVLFAAFEILLPFYAVLPTRPLALVVAIAAVVLYRKFQPVRSLFSVLALAAPAFVIIFLFISPVSTTVLPTSQPAAAKDLERRPDIALVLFDELPLLSLLDAEGELDRARYPGFARLADTSTWYPRATTVTDITRIAVPALASGNEPRDQDSLDPRYRDNLFTWLRDDYTVRAFESEFCLEPEPNCPTQGPFAERLATMLVDHAQMTGAGRIGSWLERAGLDDPEGRGPVDVPRDIQEWVGDVGTHDEPTLYYFHSELLPHSPWRYLPDGTTYDLADTPAPGYSDAEWESRTLAEQGRLRHLTQVQYADHVLDTLLDQLEDEGKLDDTIVVVAADHGAAFRADDPPRYLRTSTIPEIATVPLFIKGPGQDSGRVDRSDARLTDVFPTLAALVGGTPEPDVDGAALDGTTRRREFVELTTGYPPARGTDTQIRFRMRSDDVHDQLLESAADHAERFGTGAVVPPTIRHPELVGADVDDVRTALDDDEPVEVDDPRAFEDVDLDARYLPLLVSGTVPSAKGCTEVVVSVDAQVVTVVRATGSGRFAAVVPESALRDGANDVRAFASSSLCERDSLDL